MQVLKLEENFDQKLWKINQSIRTKLKVLYIKQKLM